jgi:hypothetical protein
MLMLSGCVMVWIDDEELMDRSSKRIINSLGIRMNLLLVFLGLGLFNGSSSTSSFLVSMLSAD